MTPPIPKPPLHERTHDSVYLGELPRPHSWVLEVGSPDGGYSHVLQRGDRVVLGSGEGADLRIADPTVSQRHCVVRVTSERVEVEDLASKNGVHVGRIRVGHASVSDRGAFVIGRTSVVVRATGEPEGPYDEPIPGIIGTSLGMRRLATEIRRHARTRAPLLLQGESGTGKDVVAGAVHRLSRRPGNYVPLNVGALSEALADAELFGHRRGAFTGAVQNRTGAFEQAHSGTLFLDEIADLPSGIQVKLLRVVEDGAVRALGASQVVRVDVRVVSATWADLAERVAQGSFRADLYHRLSTVVLRIPPLRERKSDISELSRVLLARIREEVGEKELTSAALSTLLEYSWPGNVRELNSVLYRAAMSAPERTIRAEHVKLDKGAAKGARPLQPSRYAQVGELLREYSGNVSAAARAAGVARSTFRAWLARAEQEHDQNSPESRKP